MEDAVRKLRALPAASLAGGNLGPAFYRAAGLWEDGD